MSYYFDAFDNFFVLEKKLIPDGSGDYYPNWNEGAKIKAKLTRGQSSEIRQAEAQGLQTVYTVSFPANTPVEYNDYIKEEKTGAVYRITSRPEENKTPDSATYQACFATAVRTELPVK